MTTTIKNQLLDGVLEQFAATLEIPRSKFDEARDRYESVGNWLKRPESTLKDRSPDVYTQGSFRLGTVVKPVNGAEHYDIDLVCSLSFDKSELSQKDLKAKLGYELQKYVETKGIQKPLVEGKRCWTIEYANEAQFHLDALPCVPDTDESYFRSLIEANVDELFARTGICITNKSSEAYSQVHYQWPKSNPRGYSEWFKSRMGRLFEESARRLVENRTFASVEDVPVYAVKTPLQKAIQILKRHRDLMFKNDLKNKPISIIISTMAGHSYQGELSLSEALISIIVGLDQDPYLHWDGKQYVVQNPVRPEENFADKWKSHPTRKENYFKWVKQLRKDIGSVQTINEIKPLIEGLGLSLGASPMKDVLRSYNLDNAPADYPQVSVPKKTSGPWAAC